MSNTRKGVACLDAWTTTSGEIADLDLDDVLLGCKDDIGVVVHRWILDVWNLGKLPAISSNDAQLDDHKDVHFRHLSVLLLSVLQNQIANSRFPPRSFLTFSTTISCPLFFFPFSILRRQIHDFMKTMCSLFSQRHELVPWGLWLIYYDVLSL